MSEDAAVLQTRLDEARAALHRLATGALRVSISHNGKAVTYTPAKMGELRGYIAELESKLGQGRRRAIAVRF